MDKASSLWKKKIFLVYFIFFLRELQHYSLGQGLKPKYGIDLL